jgi:hypothetical protein
MNDQVLNAFFSIQTVVFCVVVYTIVQIVRSTLERLYKALHLKVSAHFEEHLKDFWEQWFLPGAPIITGFLLGWLVSQYPYPDPFVKTLGGRMFFGIVAGGASGYVYRFFRFYVKKFLPPEVNKKLDSVLGTVPSISPDSTPPTAEGEKPNAESKADEAQKTNDNP